MSNIIADSGTWTLGTLIGLPVGILVFLIAIVAIVMGLRTFRSGDYYGREDGGTVIAIGAGVALVTLALTVFGMWPFDRDYHQWHTVSGTVEKVNKRLVAEGKSMSERYVVVIGGQPFAVDDTRATLLEPGEEVRLSCKREWEYASTPGWACRWDQ